MLNFRTFQGLIFLSSFFRTRGKLGTLCVPQFERKEHCCRGLKRGGTWVWLLLINDNCYNCTTMDVMLSGHKETHRCGNCSHTCLWASNSKLSNTVQQQQLFIVYLRNVCVLLLSVAFISWQCHCLMAKFLHSKFLLHLSYKLQLILHQSFLYPSSNQTVCIIIIIM